MITEQLKRQLTESLGLVAVWLIYKKNRQLDEADYAILSLLVWSKGFYAFSVYQIAKQLRLHVNTIRTHCKKLVKLKYIDQKKVGNTKVYTVTSLEKLVGQIDHDLPDITKNEVYLPVAVLD